MSMVTIEKLDPKNIGLINQIAEWNFAAWKLPKERTIYRLTNHPNEDILFQLVLKIDDVPAATGGLYNNVSLHKEHPRFQILKPWVALLYTDIRYRNKGLGTAVLHEIEKKSKDLKFNKIFLYTFTAESLYKANGWTQIERVDYHGHDAVVMEKIL